MSKTTARKGVGGLKAPSDDENEIKKEKFSLTFVFENASLEYKKIHGKSILFSTDEYQLLKNSDLDKAKYRHSKSKFLTNNYKYFKLKK